jgi:hypothetical protein
MTETSRSVALFGIVWSGSEVSLVPISNAHIDVIELVKDTI